MIVIPIIGIAAMGGYLLWDKDTPAESKPEKSTRIETLVEAVPRFEKEEGEVIGMLRGEQPGAEARAEALMKEIDEWLDEWEALTRELRDSNGSWKKQYAGYGDYASRINKVRYNLSRAMPF